MREPIAIIGIGCRYPGGVTNPETFWNLLINEVDAITEIPASRFDLNEYYDSVPATPGKVMSKWGGYLDKIDEFDAAFFGISPREAERMDPQQRLLLEVTWEALEDAGQVPDTLQTQQTGVFVGQWLSDFESRLFRDPSKVDFYMTTGSGRYSSSGRLSYNLGLQGPSLTIDTACSSSLVAVHLAVQSLRNDECQVALAGAANVILQPHITIAYSQSKMMAPDGHCKFGDAQADGYVRSEGAGMIVLKRLSDALADGDPVYAIIRGSAVNNDGKTSGFMATPGSAGQEEMLRKAYANAEVLPGVVQYVEAHGTGTNAGDPVEIGALGGVLAPGRAADQPCMIGSVKTNFGHTEGAAGMAGLIKVVLALKHQMLPASLHFNNPSPKIPWDQLPVRVQASTTAWPPHDGPALGGVSAFGIAGTNAHIVLQEAPGDVWTGSQDTTARVASGIPQLLPLSAQTDDALHEVAKRYQAIPDEIALPDASFTASTRRVHHNRRLALVASSREDLGEKLTTFLDGEKLRGVSASSDTAFSPRKIVFVFPGQGGQWVGMGRQLLEQEPVFREALERCEQAMRPYVDWSLTDELKSGTRFDEINIIQPLLFAVQVSLSALWRSWGVEPDAVIGHSMGEVAGAFVAGVLTLDDAAHVICRRSQLMRQVSGKGAMAVVELTFDEALIAINGFEDRLGIAVSNGPRSTVLSGDPAALEKVLEILRAKEVFCRPVKVDVAAHSPHMEALRPQLVADLKELQPLETTVPVYSTVNGHIQESGKFDAEYWGANLRKPVLFASAVQDALVDGFNTFIEISPHPVLLTAVEQSIKAEGLEDGLTLPSGRRSEDERAVMLEALGSLYVAGYPLDWSLLYPQGKILRLPTYPWQRERFWAVEAELDTGSGRNVRRAGANPLLGQYFKSYSGTHFWETQIDLAEFPYLTDHRVQGRAILPAAAYVEMALGAAREAFGINSTVVEQMNFQEAIFLSEAEQQVIQIMIGSEMQGKASFQCFSRSATAEENWTLRASGILRVRAEPVQINPESPTQLVERMGNHTSGHKHYEAMKQRHLEYGPAFQGVKEIWGENNERVAQFQQIDSLRSSGYQIHPALLDAAFQVLLETLTDENSISAIYLPTSLKTASLQGRPDAEEGLWAYAKSTTNTDGVLEGDVLLLDSAGHVLAAVEGLRMQRLEQAEASLDELLYQIQWVAATPLPEPAKTAQAGTWLVLKDTLGLADRLASGLNVLGENVITVTPGNAYLIGKSNDFQVNPSSLNDFEQLLHDLASGGYPKLAGVIHLWSVQPSQELSLDGLHHTERLGAISALNLVRALAEAGVETRLYLVTPESLDASLMSGFGAVLANEHPELRVSRIMVDGEASFDALFRELWAEDEDQVSLQNNQRFAARLENNVVTETESVNEQQVVNAADVPFRAEVTTPGILEGLKLRGMARKLPQTGEVEIEVHATGLNFMNVMSALGIYPGYERGVGPIGIECAGRIVSVGEGVSDWQVGDDVVGVAYNSLATHVITDARLIARKPANITFEQAATLPIVFLTAYYALNRLGAMEQGERVLIHSATGGVGLAAIQLANRAGAEIWATAGTAEKRDYLQSLGVQHIMDSRSLAFADEIMAQTGGDGVDLVLNSLAGEAIPRGLSVLRPYGRFLEIGKRDIYQNLQVGLLPFQNSLSYFAIDLDRMVHDRPNLIGSMLREIMALVEAGELQPIPAEIYPISQVVDAFRHMAQAKHIGKIVMSLREDNVTIEVQPRSSIRGDSSYLISGGLGGIGLEVAHWLVGQGARQLVLTGRRNPSQAAQQAITELEAAGAEVKVATADIADPTAVENLIADIRRTMLPLRGVFHAAGVLEDSTISHLDEEHFQKAVRPKMDGAWNLHQATHDIPLDHFVLFSSVSALVGIAGQANYAAGNAFMDVLAHFRRANGQPALSINWGPWSEVGLAAEQTNRGERLASRGLGGITTRQGIAILEKLLTSPAAQVAAMPFDVSAWVQTYPTASRASLLKGLLQANPVEASSSEEAAETKDDLIAILMAAEPGRARRSLLENQVKEQVARVLGLSVVRIDVQKPLRNMGIDSLMTLELRNRLEALMKLPLPATLVFNYPTVAALTGHLAERLGVSLEAEKNPVPEPLAEKVNEVETLSRDEVEAMLAEELKSVDELLKGD